MIRFLLNERLCEIENLAPDMTVLEYLRTVERQRGTKEGCASGDCGACTVVVAECSEEPGRLRYKSINSCITFVGSLQGKQLITVEALKQGDRLHPAQQAMVECHGSQCGFCTPGFVMSIFAMGKNQSAQPQQQAGDVANFDPKAESPSRHEIDLALGGNLCRCTGYRPIIDAAKQALSTPFIDQFSAAEADTYQQLVAIMDRTDEAAIPSLAHRGGHFFAPASLAELIDLLTQYPDARLLGGGTDLALEVTQQLKSIATLIYTGNVVDMQRLESTAEGLHIGGAVNYSEAMSMLERHLPEFARMITRLGARQVRNQGTFAGNVANASPIGDTPPVLMVLEATVNVAGPGGSRQIPICDFFTGYRQTLLPEASVIESIHIPFTTRSWYRQVYKVSKRLEDDISAVLAAMLFKVEEGVINEARIAFGGMAATPIRVAEAEQALIGQPMTLAGIKSAQLELEKTLKPLTDVRASAAYRTQIAVNLLARAVLEFDPSYASLSEAAANKVAPQRIMEVVDYA